MNKHTMLPIVLCTCSLAGLAQEGRPIPCPEALERAGIALPSLGQPVNDALILGNGDLNALLFAEGERFFARTIPIAGHSITQQIAKEFGIGLPEAEELTLGLFVPDSVRVAIARGRAAAGCARELVLRTTAEPGVLRVVQDLYDPQRGFFVTAEYDKATWTAERLDGHSRIRVGSLEQQGGVLEPFLYPGGRVDVESAGRVREGRLHLGFALLGDEDLFSATA